MNQKAIRQSLIFGFDISEFQMGRRTGYDNSREFPPMWGHISREVNPSLTAYLVSLAML